MKPDRAAENPSVLSRSWALAALAAWCAGSAVVMFWGAILSSRGALASPLGWVIGLMVAAAAAYGCSRPFRPRRPHDAFAPARAIIRSQPALLVLGAGVAAVVVAGALTAFCAAPSNWDAMAYQLARVGHYLQQGSLADYDANFFSQEQHARGTSIIACALLTICGRSDRLVGLPQLLAYGLCLVAIHTLARQIGRSRVAALAAAASFGVLTIVAMEAPTAQNDLVLASFIGAGLVGTLAYLAGGARSSLLLGAGGFALATAVKASALTCVPAALVVIAGAGICSPVPRPAVLRRAGALTAATAAAILILAWPAGYWKNLQRFGNPIGGPQMFEHHTDTGPAEHSRTRMGILNLVRFSADLCTLDGLPESWLGAPGAAVKRHVGAALQSLGFDAASSVSTNAAFSWSRPRFADENLSFFGWNGVAWLVPGCLGALWFWRRRPLAAALALGAIVFLIGQSFAGRYDPWRGRHFIYGAMFAAPAAAWLFETPRRTLRLASWAAAAIGAAAIVPALLWRSPNPLVSRAHARNLFELDRLQQMAGQHPSYPALAAFDRLVPEDATVIVALPGDEYEYPLFGRDLRRRLIPYAHAQRHPELAAGAEYLLYDRWLPLARQPSDIFLGYHWNLRRLTPSAAH
ncbi:MAG TPA: hypothetical protein VG710_14720 [Opitutus sp.]|nr:hypothetical protein [Opitutus sp.]